MPPSCCSCLNKQILTAVLKFNEKQSRRKAFMGNTAVENILFVRHLHVDYPLI